MYSRPRYFMILIMFCFIIVLCVLCKEEYLSRKYVLIIVGRETRLSRNTILSLFLFLINLYSLGLPPPRRQHCICKFQHCNFACFIICNFGKIIHTLLIPLLLILRTIGTAQVMRHVMRSVIMLWHNVTQEQPHVTMS